MRRQDAKRSASERRSATTCSACWVIRRRPRRSFDRHQLGGRGDHRERHRPAGHARERLRRVGFTACRAARRARDDRGVLAAVSDPAGPLALRPGSKLTFRGDAEAAAVTLIDHWNRPGHHGGFRTAVRAWCASTGRLALRTRPRARNRDARTDVEDITVCGRTLGAPRTRDNRQLAADYISASPRRRSRWRGWTGWARFRIRRW
jgi:hypothetical protein